MLEHRLRKRLYRWLFRLQEAESGEVVLHRRRVFILPTRAGFGFCVMLIALFIGSINYNLSLGFGFTFLIAACALIDMHLTFYNLAHLHLAAGHAPPVFAGEKAQFELHLINHRKYGRYAIWLDFVDQGLPEVAQAADIAAHSTHSLMLSTSAKTRGWLPAPRIRLQTRFPLGLLQAWSYWQPDATVLVYPHPEEHAPPLPIPDMDKKDGQGYAGQDDFAGIRNYQSGDSLKRLAWRQMARMDGELGEMLLTKHFEGGANTEVIIDFQHLPPHMDLDTKLSRMTRWVSEAEARNIPYGFQLGNTRLAAATGHTHQEACLRALALYEGL